MTDLREAPAPAGRLGLLARPNFRRLWVGETTSGFGSSVSSFALPLVAVSVLHASVLTVSIVMAAAWVPWLVVGLPAGAWVDRMSRRRVMIAADLVSICAFASVVAAGALGLLTAAHLILAALLAGTATVFFSTAYRAFLPALLGPTELLEGNAKLQGSQQVAQVAGPGAAGLIAQATSAVGGVAVDVLSFVVSLVFLIRVVGLQAGAAGVLLALCSLGGVAGALVARRLAAGIGSARAVLLCKFALPPFGLLIPLTHRGVGAAWLLLGGVAVIGGVVAGNVIWAGFVQTYYPAELLGRISTSVAVVNYGAIPLGAVLAGAVATCVGTRLALWIMLGGFVLSSCVLLIGPLPRMRELPTRPS